MSALDAHPELVGEQAYVDHAYECMEAMFDRVERMNVTGRNDYEQAVFEAWKESRLLALSDTTSALCFGRLDTAEDDTWYIGRRHVEDRHGEVVLVDWRAPVATAFYRATGTDPMGLERRRQFLVEGRQ